MRRLYGATALPGRYLVRKVWRKGAGSPQMGLIGTTHYRCPCPTPPHRSFYRFS